MTATQKKRTPAKQESDEWISLFQELETETQSLVYVKRMMVIAVSSITYLRGIFPEDSYTSRYLEDLCIKVLRQNCSCPGACKLVKWLMGCFDALEKRYLQIVLIGVHTDPDDSNHVVESYQFKFRYTDQGPQMEILRNENVAVNVTMEDTKKASLLLIRKLFLLMQNLEALPNAVYLSMKLYYNDDVTPPTYEPPGFKAGVYDSLWFEGTAVHFRVGDLQSRFHTMKVRVTAAQSRLGKLQDTSQQSEKGGVKETNTLKAAGKVTNDFDIQDLPSEDESAAQFKISKRTIAKRKRTGSKLSKTKRRNPVKTYNTLMSDK
ncbi:zebrafish testis-expressed 38 [Triplophysa rosa]|uniref:Zebrafish testis-expressed 38 n=1 Tax=Triplophysa rosa TaxID=992332 RepID=A0A9W7WWK0_TRIRA|nr:zebrafish testis-expressed 38 [Triplophysa rosa]KAI7809559.1 zebrafish testis-expressed 38 [Triplophysa rosa]